MRDSEVVASIVARDPRGLAEAYDRYAARIFSFCRSQLGEPADAAGAVKDTFVIAASAVSELYDPSRLRPWLYAVARNECHRRMQAGARPAASEEAVGPDGEAVDVYDDTKAQPLDLVRAAIVGLDPDDQEVIELSLRHRLQGPDLADTLGVPRDYADGLVSRARAHLETSLGALVVGRVGRKACPDLESLFTSADGSTHARLRAQVNAHIKDCPACGRRKRQVLGPVLKLGFAPLGPIPSELRDQVLLLATDTTPAATAERDAIVARAGAFGVYGFPEAQAIEDESGPWWRIVPRPLATIAGAAATAAVAAVAAVAILVVPRPHQPESAQPANLSSPVRSAIAGGQDEPSTSAAGAPGAKGISAGTRGKASTVRVQSGAIAYHAAAGGLTQAGSLYAVGGTKKTPVVAAGTSHPATHPATHKSSPPSGAKQSSAPAKTPPSTTGTGPSSSPTPVTSTTPPASPPPVTSPAPTPSPTASDTAPVVEPSIDVTVGSLLGIGVQLGG
jgi:RNA polymerase sigma factor (sigma-70 family)